MNQTLRNLNKLYRNLGTWQAVADYIGFNRATVSRWCNGTKKASKETREWIAQVTRGFNGEWKGPWE